MTSTEWPNHRLDALRGLGDADVDDLLDELRTRDRDVIEQLFVKFVADQLALDPAGWPNDLIEWSKTSGVRPPWQDDDQVGRAVDVFDEWMPEVLTSYLVASLPTSYAAADGALVLTRISLLAAPDALTRRILETLFFVLHVNESGGLQEGGRGVDAARKTRVFHALVRVMIEDFDFDMRQPGRVGQPWNRQRHGVPVNQEDLLGTMWTFALTPLIVLERAGVRLDDADRDAVVHLWCVVGHHLGIGAGAQPPLLPMTHAEATACWERIQTHQFVHSEEGAGLTTVLVDRCRQMIPIPLLRGLPAASMYDNLGPQVASMLGIARPGATRYFVHLTGWLFRLTLRVPGGRLLRAPLRHLLKRFAFKWLRQARSPGRPVNELHPQQLACIKPLYATRRARAGLASPKK